MAQTKEPPSPAQSARQPETGCSAKSPRKRIISGNGKRRSAIVATDLDHEAAEFISQLLGIGVAVRRLGLQAASQNSHAGLRYAAQFATGSELGRVGAQGDELFSGAGRKILLTGQGMV